MFYVVLPRYSERPTLFHDLKDNHVFLRTMKGALERVNNVLLDPSLPVEVLLPSNPRTWEKEEWDKFQRMNAEEKRSVIEPLCREMVERHRQAIESKQRLILKLEKHFNDQEPKAKRKNLGGRMFITESDLKRCKRCQLLMKWADRKSSSSCKHSTME